MKLSDGNYCKLYPTLIFIALYNLQRVLVDTEKLITAIYYKGWHIELRLFSDSFLWVILFYFFSSFDWIPLLHVNTVVVYQNKIVPHLDYASRL